MEPDKQIAVALLGVALRPERQSVVQVAQRLGWSLAQLGQVIGAQRAALEVAEIQLHPASAVEAHQRADGCIVLDHVAYSGLSWPLLRTGVPSAASLTRVLTLVETWVAQMEAAGMPLPGTRVMQLRAGVVWAATVGGRPPSNRW
jgi:hypothetical protein